MSLFYNSDAGDGIICININECESSNHKCSEHAQCIDTDGSYECNCLPGFIGDGVNCDDVNECTDFSEVFASAEEGRINACDINAECSNSLGSFSCKCLAGFEGV